MTWLDAFKECVGHRAQRLALRRYVQGLPQRQRPQVDGADAGAGHRSRLVSGLPALHHRWAVGRRARVATPAGAEPRARGVADHRWHRRSQAGAGLGRCGASVRRRPGEDCQLSGRRDRGAVDRGARLSARSGALPARGMADRLGPPACARAGRDRLSRKGAPSAYVAPANPRERIHADRCARRRGIRRQQRVPGQAASAAPAVRSGGFVASHDLSRHPAPRVADHDAPRPPAKRVNGRSTASPSV